MPWPDESRREGASLFAADEDNLDALLADEVLDGVREPCPLVTQIVEVGFADQATQAALFGDVRKQYVNLSRVQARQADAEITSDNQIGRSPPLVVRVTPARATSVRVKLQRTLNRGGFPGGSSTLSARERGLAHLQWARSERSHTTDENGLLLLEPGLPISALGGGEFRVMAALPGEGWVTGSNAVQVMRRVYLRPVPSYAAGYNTAVGAMGSIRTHLGSLGIEVKRVQRASSVTLGVAEENTLATALDAIGRRALASRTAHVRELRPHSVAVIVGEFIDDAIAMRSFSVDVHRGADGQFPAVVSVPLRLTAGATTTQYTHVPLDDGSSFGSCKVSTPGHTEDVDSLQVTGLTRFAKRLRVNISAAHAAFPLAAVVRLTLRVKTVDGWAVGWAYNNEPVIYLNMRDPETDAVLSANMAQALMIHELGHKLHLTARSDPGQPDTQPHRYFTGQDGVTHVGNHCSHGVPAGTLLNTDAAETAADCTMWGALVGITTYCSECKTSLRKVDLGSGF
jgi:hypothetical protein